MIDFKLKKQPKQKRSQETVKAVIQASAQILEQKGYSALNTNDVASLAGVSVGSIYEYFPGKEAIVATLVDDLVEEIMQTIIASLQQSRGSDKRSTIRAWIEMIYQFICLRRALFTALLFQVPYIYQIPSLNSLANKILEMVLNGSEYFNALEHSKFETEQRYFISAASAGVILSVTLLPPGNINIAFVLDNLADKIILWSEPPVIKSDTQ